MPCARDIIRRTSFSIWEFLILIWGKVIASECGRIASPRLDVGIPKSRDEIGEGNEEFNTAQSG